MKILTGKNNPILRKKARDIPKEKIKDYVKLAEEMINLMQQAGGIGLAAPQIGILVKLIVIDAPSPLVLFNPRLTWQSKTTSILEEGCLSLPGIYGLVKRPEKIRVKALNIKGEKISLKADGLLSHVIQHEIDHLNGILFIDKALKITKTK